MNFEVISEQLKKLKIWSSWCSPCVVGVLEKEGAKKTTFDPKIQLKSVKSCLSGFAKPKLKIMAWMSLFFNSNGINEPNF